METLKLIGEHAERQQPSEGCLSPALSPDEVLTLWLVNGVPAMRYKGKRRPYNRPLIPPRAVKSRVVMLPPHVAAWLEVWADRYGVMRPDMIGHLYESYMNLMHHNPALVAPLPTIRKFPHAAQPFKPSTQQERSHYEPSEALPDLDLVQGEELFD